MKINVEVDVTPEEARRFFGLPDVTPLQEMAMAHIKEQMERGMDGTLLPGLMRSMVAGGIQSMEAWQEAFGDMVARGRPSGSDSSARPNKSS